MLIWLKQIRAPFLSLSVLLVLLGAAMACRDAQIGRLYINTILLMLGVLLAHIAVNLFNELDDYYSTIDSYTKHTPFSGGSGMLQQKKTTPKQVWWVAYTSLTAAFFIGIYFTYQSGWPIIIFMLIGFIAIRFYTNLLSKWLLGELFCGFALGTMVVLGVYYSLTTQLTTTAVILAIPPGILTALLLLLNEIPDKEADEQGGRCHLVICFGEKNSIYIYAAALAIMYSIIVETPKLGVSTGVYLSLLTIPIALITIITSYKNIGKSNFQRAQLLNTILVLTTITLLAIGILL